MNTRLALGIAAAALVLPAAAAAQTPSAPPANQTPAAMFAAFLKGQYNTYKRNVIGSVQKMPEEHFSFEPTPEVRNWGELSGHVVLGNYIFCSEAKNQPNPKQGVNFEVIKTKAEMVQAMNESIAYCDEVFAALDENSVLGLVKVAGPNNTQRDVPRANRLGFFLIHGNEHYGNMVTYLRLKGIVPPSSEPPPAR